MEFKIPLHVNIEEISHQLDIDLSDLNSGNNPLESLSIYLNITNGIPLSGLVELFFLDQGEAIIPVTQNRIELVPALINSQGYSTESSYNTYELILDETDLDKLKRAKKLNVQVSLNGQPDGSPVVLRTFDEIQIELFSNIKYRIDEDEL